MWINKSECTFGMFAVQRPVHNVNRKNYYDLQQIKRKHMQSKWANRPKMRHDCNFVWNITASPRRHWDSIVLEPNSTIIRFQYGRGYFQLHTLNGYKLWQLSSFAFSLSSFSFPFSFPLTKLHSFMHTKSLFLVIEWGKVPQMIGLTMLLPHLALCTIFHHIFYIMLNSRCRHWTFDGVYSLYSWSSHIQNSHIEIVLLSMLM